MRKHRSTMSRRAVAAAWVAILACELAAISPVARAAELTEAVRFAIEPQGLDTALLLFSKQAGISISAPTVLLSGKRSAGVTGQIVVEEALRALLEGTGLGYKRMNAHTVAVGVIVEGDASRDAPERSMWLAQSAPPPTPEATAAEAEVADHLAEIVVTATRREQSVRDVPYNIQAISAETLRDIGALGASDFVRTVPGMSFTDSGKREGVEFILRGLTTGSVGATTSTYVDDTEINLFTGLLDLALLDVERVEVLRGPQGTLYGGGAIGGTVRYITTKPSLTDRSLEVSTQLSGTRRGGLNYGASTTFNTPLVTDKVALRASVGYFDNDGFIRNVALGRDNINFDRTLSARIALRAQPSERLSADFTYYLQRARFGPFAQEYSSLAPFDASFFGPGGERESIQLGNLALGYDFGFAQLTSSTSYVREKEDTLDDYTYVIRDQIFGSFVDPPELLPPFTQYTDQRDRSHTVSEEIRLVSKGSERFDWIAGLYWLDRRSRSHEQEWVPIPYPGLEEFAEWLGVTINDDKEYYLASDPSTFRQWAVFGELGVRLTPRLRVSFGARHFDYRLRERFWAIDQYSPSGRDENGFARSEALPDEYFFGAADHEDEIYRLNASYQLAGGDLLYTTVAEGFRPGGFNLVTPSTGIPIDQRQYDPDSIVSYEIGGKFSLGAGRVYLSSALYYIDWEDIQTSVPSGLGYSIQGNAGKASSRGFELELQARRVLLEGLKVSLGYSFTDVKLEETINELGFEGDRAPRVPRHSGSLILDYDFPMAGGWSYGFNVVSSYTGSSNTDFGALRPDEAGVPQPNSDFLRQDAYWLTSVSVRAEHDAWRLRLFADNVFDEHAQLNRIFADSSTVLRGPFILNVPNRPRTVGLEITRRF